VYQIYPRSFADSNGDGVGDLRGITDHLDHVESLGVDAIWLSPIFRSPMKDFGYDVADYCSVDPVFGTDADLDELIDELHRRDMRLLLDWVPNHTSDQHPWFVESRSSRSSPKRNWYVWRDRRPDGSPPTNWMAQFKGVPAWTHDERTDQSYLHLFLAEQPDLNWSNPEVESAMHETLRHWLDRGVDGFRADVVHLIGKGDDVDDLPDHLARMAVICVDRPLGHVLLRRIRTVLDEYPHEPMMVGEVYLLEPGQSATYLGDAEAGAGELHLSFDFRPVHTPWEPAAIHRAIADAQHDFAEPHWPTWVLSNHDRSRHRTRYGTEARARAAAVLSLTVRGTPFLYAGEELGLMDATVPPDRVVDPDGRDGCRAPLPWTPDGDAATGHGWPTRPWLPFPDNATEAAVSCQLDDPGSMLALYRRLLALRRTHRALHSGSMHLHALDGDVVVFERRAGDDAIVVAINLADRPVPIPDAVRGAGLLLATGSSRTDLAGGDLDADEAVVAYAP
jgi:alpha-glucosidase